MDYRELNQEIKSTALMPDLQFTVCPTCDPETSAPHVLRTQGQPPSGSLTWYRVGPMAAIQMPMLTSSPCTRPVKFKRRSLNAVSSLNTMPHIPVRSPPSTSSFCNYSTRKRQACIKLVYRVKASGNTHHDEMSRHKTASGQSALLRGLTPPAPAV